MMPCCTSPARGARGPSMGSSCSSWRASTSCREVLQYCGVPIRCNLSRPTFSPHATSARHIEATGSEEHATRRGSTDSTAPAAPGVAVSSSQGVAPVARAAARDLAPNRRHVGPSNACRVGCSVVVPILHRVRHRRRHLRPLHGVQPRLV